MSLLDLVANGQSDEIEEALVNVTNINGLFSNKTLLRVAIKGDTQGNNHQTSERGDAKVVRLLLEHGADPNKINYFQPPICTATFEKQKHMALMLIFFGANVNSTENYKLIKESNKFQYRLPLEMAVNSFKVGIVEMLVKKGAIYNQKSIKYVEDLMEKQKDEKIMEDYEEVKKYRKLDRIKDILDNNYRLDLEKEATELINSIPNYGIYRPYIKFLSYSE